MYLLVYLSKFPSKKAKDMQCFPSSLCSICHRIKMKWLPLLLNSVDSLTHAFFFPFSQTVPEFWEKLNGRIRPSTEKCNNPKSRRVCFWAQKRTLECYFPFEMQTPRMSSDHFTKIHTFHSNPAGLWSLPGYNTKKPHFTDSQELKLWDRVCQRALILLISP